MLINAFAAIFEALGLCLAKYVIFQTPSIFDIAPVIAVILFIHLERRRHKREREEEIEKTIMIFTDFPSIREHAKEHPRDYCVDPYTLTPYDEK